MSKRTWGGVLVIIALVVVGGLMWWDLGGQVPANTPSATAPQANDDASPTDQATIEPEDDSAQPAPAPAPAAPAADDVATPPMPAHAGHAVIDYVHDGDTLFLTDGRKVRLLGIDTPEVGENRECLGDEARQHLREVLPEGTAVRTVTDVRARDQYDRHLLFLYTDDGRLVNLDMIRDGWAEAVVLKPNVMWADTLEDAEDAAQRDRLGIWGATCR